MSNPESFNQKNTPPTAPSRRTFLNQIGIAAIGAMGVTTNVEAGTKDLSLEYSGFNPTNHEKTVIETQIKRIVPDARSVQISARQGSSLPGIIVLDISIVRKDGSLIESGMPSTLDITQASKGLSDLFRKLEKEIQK